MNLQQELASLYDSFYGSEFLQTSPIPPIYHANKAVQIEIQLLPDGTFYDAFVLTDEDQKTLIPVIDAFAGRTSGASPYPLADKLHYMINPNSKYRAGIKKGYYEKYILQLQEWGESAQVESLGIILKYLKEQDILKDLVDKGILLSDENLNVSKSSLFGKKTAADVKDLFVKFSVRGILEGKPENDKQLIQSWIDYVEKKFPGNGISSISGEIQYITQIHSPVIGNAKLFSANDEKNFVFRGRFEDKEAASSIGMKDSVKFHTMLSWILANHSIHIGDFKILIWSEIAQNLPVADLITSEIVERNEEAQEIEWVDDTEVDIRKKMWGAIIREENESLIEQDLIHILVLKKVNDGRVAVLEYKQENMSRYLSALEKWYTTSSWNHRYCIPDSKNPRKKRLVQYEGTPPLKHIVESLYGHEIDGDVKVDWSDGFSTQILKDLFNLVIESRRIPEHLLRKAIYRASNPQKYSSEYNWQNVVEVSCGIIRKYYNDKLEANYTMILDKQCKDKNYLFGRLLAVADYIENSAYTNKNDSGHPSETNALRFMSNFAQHPATTWPLLFSRVNVYLSRLSPGQKTIAEKSLEEIMNTFESFDDYTSNTPLNGLYLLGFYHQRKDLYTSKKDKESVDID